MATHADDAASEAPSDVGDLASLAPDLDDDEAWKAATADRAKRARLASASTRLGKARARLSKVSVMHSPFQK